MPTVSKNKFKCRLCAKRFPTLNTLSSHHLRAHPKPNARRFNPPSRNGTWEHIKDPKKRKAARDKQWRINNRERVRELANAAYQRKHQKVGIFKSKAAQAAAVAKSNATKARNKAAKATNPRSEYQRQWYANKKKQQVATVQLEHQLNWCPNCRCNLKAHRLAMEFANG